ncbi:MAG TPA: single-stranded DNA-binding protein [Dermatophilaceae bacterium]|nr:single-stranded DNA-binding protein [Dermatophilaceae bacterium]
MNETYVTVSGNVVGDPVVRATRANVPFVTFRVASNVRRVDFKTGEYIDAGTNFVNVTAFRALGVNLSNSLKKGEPVIVYGRMRINQWVNGDRSGTTVEIDAYNVGHDLNRGQTTFTKVAKPQLNQNDRMADPEVQDAADQLDHDAAMLDGDAYMEGDEPLTEGFTDLSGGNIDVAAADTDAYETVGAGSR